GPAAGGPRHRPRPRGPGRLEGAPRRTGRPGRSQRKIRLSGGESLGVHAERAEGKGARESQGSLGIGPRLRKVPPDRTEAGGLEENRRRPLPPRFSKLGL